jgi:hypothetical protein
LETVIYYVRLRSHRSLDGFQFFLYFLEMVTIVGCLRETWWRECNFFGLSWIIGRKNLKNKLDEIEGRWHLSSFHRPTSKKPSSSATASLPASVTCPSSPPVRCCSSRPLVLAARPAALPCPLPCYRFRYVNETLISYPKQCFDLEQKNQKICMCMLRSGKDLPIISISSWQYLATSLSFSSDLDILKHFFPKCKWFEGFVLICMLIPWAWVPIKK